MKRMAFGFTTPEGREPALNASTSAPPSMRANASAIWLRLAFSTQTNNTRFIRNTPGPASSTRRPCRDSFRSSFLAWLAGGYRAAGAGAGATVLGEVGDQGVHPVVVRADANDAAFALVDDQGGGAQHVEVRAQG